MWYGIKPERHAKVDAELANIYTYLVALADEIDREAPVTNKRGFTYSAACAAGNAVAHLRHLLADDQEKQRIGEEIRRRSNQTRG